ncbi:MAG: tetratricopeptide repeat protein [Deltaproteobacteria bacterium]|nr:tetratricopeptide repeat protein [Deltaproteobacteria bacterium]MBW2661923.1 tetratricopeptide repeat protein [Deltaproteobacteria bacterium]
MRKAPINIIVFCIIFLLITCPWEARGEEDNIKRQFEYAESLFKEGDFYRAITEYKRFIFFFPEEEKAEKCYFMIGKSYFKAKKWVEAIDAMKVFIAKFPRSFMLNDALYLKGVAEKKFKKYDDALSTFEEIIKTSSGEYKNKAIYQNALVLVDIEDWKRASKTFLKIPEESVLSPAARIFSSGLENFDNLPRKSPATAGVLAAIIPGAGHLYTERPRDALVAFLLNGAFIWAAVELFNDENYVAGGVFTFFELGWYSGNIYSAVSNAHKYNRRVKKNFLENLRDKCFLSYYHNNKSSSNGLILSMRF